MDPASQAGPSNISPEDWARLNLLIHQVTARLEVWEREELRAERGFRRAIRGTGHLTRTQEAVCTAIWDDRRLGVPTDCLERDRQLLAQLKELRTSMLRQTAEEE